MKKKYKRDYIENIINMLKDMGIFNLFQKYEICGSFRRKKEMIGDIDIVCILSEPHEFVLNFFNNCNIEIHKKPAGYQFDFNDIKIDIFVANEKDYWLNVLFWTGPHYFTINLRNKFYRNGFLLTPKMISSLKTKKRLTDYCLIKSEKEIFDLIKYNYVYPEDRY